MDQNKVDMYLIANGKYFDSYQIVNVRDMLLDMDDSKFIHLQSANLHNPSTILIVSILAGSLGIDRFMIGDTGMGIGKLLTCGGLGIWTIVDWFLIMGATREKNFQKLERILY